MIEDQSDECPRPANDSSHRSSAEHDEKGVESTTTAATGDSSTPQTRRKWAETAAQWVVTAIGGLIFTVIASLFKMPAKIKPRPNVLVPIRREVDKQIQRTREEEELRRRQWQQGIKLPR